MKKKYKKIIINLINFIILISLFLMCGIEDANNILTLFIVLILNFLIIIGLMFLKTYLLKKWSLDETYD